MNAKSMDAFDNIIPKACLTTAISAEMEELKNPGNSLKALTA